MIQTESAALYECALEAFLYSLKKLKNIMLVNQEFYDNSAFTLNRNNQIYNYIIHFYCINKPNHPNGLNFIRITLTYLIRQNVKPMIPLLLNLKYFQLGTHWKAFCSAKLLQKLLIWSMKSRKGWTHISSEVHFGWKL